MALALPKMCSMGGSQTGLVGTIGVALLNPDGTVHTARATAGIYEIGGGCYGKNISFPDNWAGSVKWDTGGGSPVYACEEYTVDGLVDTAMEDLDDVKGSGFVKDTDSLVDIRPETDKIQAGIIDVPGNFKADVSNLDVAVSTRNATTPPTVGAIRAEMEGVGTKLTAVKDKTDNLPANPAPASEYDARMQTIMFGKEVIIDIVNGVSGTAFPIGTRAQPSNNLTDALAICAANNLIRLRTRSDLTIGPTHNVDNMSITSHGIMGIDVALQAGCSAKNSFFQNLNLSGTITEGDVLFIQDCSIGALASFCGIMRACTLGEGCEISLYSWANIIECFCGGEPTNEPEINLGTAGLVMPCYCGNIKFTGKTGGPRAMASFTSGKVSIASSCVAGIIEILGTGELEKDESGAGCTVDVDAALTNEFIAKHVWAEIVSENVKSGSFGELLNFVYCMEGGRWKIDTTLKQMIFYEDNNVTEVARFDLKDAFGDPAFENVFERVRA